MTERYLLRDLKTNTELLILAEFVLDPNVRRKDLAKRLDVTEQAVAQYIADLEKDQLVSISDGTLKSTKKGMQLMQERFSRLNDEIEEILRQMRVIDTCLALADARIKKGDKVGLVMREGRLYAIPGAKTDSRGISRNEAKTGEEVSVGSLSGIVQLKLGQLLALRVPEEDSGGSRNLNARRARKAIQDFKYDDIAVGDLIGETSAKKLGIEPTIFHASVQASLNALSKGLNVIFIGTKYSIDQMTASIDGLRKNTGFSISYNVLDISKN
ncbi:MAG: winged helix-turn-helix transcriptional regulator [Thermoplasmata archaeon]|nr:winged helix-turn-helix transcriptional regulator [Thermoplasmata archaeon]